MPGSIVHVLLGIRLLDRWHGASEAPFRSHVPALRDAFLTGSLAPDMGMLPGGDPLLSDLAHYVRSGQLSRTLVAEARTERERAFAWGWFAHVLADVLIHPLINLKAGEVRGAAGPLTFADDPALHVAVELGFDQSLFERWRRLRLGPLPPASAYAPLLQRSFQLVYGHALGHRSIRKSLTAWRRWHRGWFRLAGAGNDRTGWLGLLAYRSVRALVRLASERSVTRALLHPLAPSPEGSERMERALHEFPRRFDEYGSNYLRSLPDYNLDTGRVETPDSYPLTVATLARLQR